MFSYISFKTKLTNYVSKGEGLQPQTNEIHHRWLLQNSLKGLFIVVFLHLDLFADFLCSRVLLIYHLAEHLNQLHRTIHGSLFSSLQSQLMLAGSAKKKKKKNTSVHIFHLYSVFYSFLLNLFLFAPLLSFLDLVLCNPGSLPFLPVSHSQFLFQPLHPLLGTGLNSYHV